MADPFTTLMEQLSALGFFEFLLPWLFTFAVVYGLLAKADLFGGANTRISALIGIIAAFFVTPYAGPWLASYFSTIFGGAAVVLAAILVIVLFAAMLGIKGEGLGQKKYGLPIVAIIGIVLFFFAAGGDLGFFGTPAIGDNVIMTIIFLAILVIAVWLVVGGKKEISPEERRQIAVEEVEKAKARGG